MERKDWKLDLRVNEHTELEMFEDLAWLMARHADPTNVPDSPEEFMDQFNTFSIYQILPLLIELWGLNVQTEVESRKNLAKVSGK